MSLVATCLSPCIGKEEQEEITFVGWIIIIILLVGLMFDVVDKMMWIVVIQW
jgi:uncharacterized Rmd1/YagE family protein